MQPRALCLLVAACAAWPALAQPSPQARPATPEPQIKRSVIEDDQVRIEELRVRGQVQRITVSPKASGVRPYEIVPADAARDAAQHKGLSGQRLWQLFLF